MKEGQNILNERWMEIYKINLKKNEEKSEGSKGFK